MHLKFSILGKYNIFCIKHFFQTSLRIILFLDIIHYLVFYLKHNILETVLFPTSDKNLLSWAQSIELVSISGDRPN
jgi:hypothetical protein